MSEDRGDEPEPEIGGEDRNEESEPEIGGEGDRGAESGRRNQSQSRDPDADRAGVHGHDHDDAPGHDDHRDHEEPTAGRLTSPMQPYRKREAGIGFLILLVGVAVAYALPLLAA